MGMIGEFKDFIARGNVVDLAVGVVIGAAFGKIVTTLVDKVIMPPIGMLVGGVDFSKLALTLKEASVDAAGKEVPAVAIACPCAKARSSRSSANQAAAKPPWGRYCWV